MTATETRCSFCGRRQDQVPHLVAGPRDVFICTDCATLVTNAVETSVRDPATGKWTHVDEKGAARMVDVGAKGETERRAVARGKLTLSKATVALVRGGDTPKGDVLATARIAGIMGAKRTSELIPLCHPLPLTHAAVDLRVEDDGIVIEATVATTARTGVEMEALTAVAVAGLTLYDTVKAVEKGARLVDVRLVEKTGGRSGDVRLE
ncbi:MAG TPA: cyclic pyranopterin monophosphate synthase MoaC [Candidatus Limnocylindria bacterium]|nr:cyclic pyranopterin monophosphate synthase MoaC [Candidatus Limnocylindria bacterium]